MKSAWLLSGALIMLTAITGATRQPGAAKAHEYIKVEVRGILRHGIAAIGGETTGTTITARGVTWELDLARQQDLVRLASTLDGKLVVVNGDFEVRKGVEIPQRWVVRVTSLRVAH